MNPFFMCIHLAEIYKIRRCKGNISQKGLVKIKQRGSEYKTDNFSKPFKLTVRNGDGLFVFFPHVSRLSVHSDGLFVLPKEINQAGVLQIPFPRLIL